MAANVETMFYTREKPWHGLGIGVKEAPTSEDALRLAGLDWKVIQQSVQTTDGIFLNGFYANVRETDGKVLGVVTDKYKVVQNTDAFAFTDSLLGEGVTYETAGSLMGGKKVWILAKLPDRYIISGDEITPYLVFTNTHDGSCAIKCCLSPVRVICNNTLNLALEKAKRIWSTVHTGNLNEKMQDARQTLLYADNYMAELGKAFERLNHIKVTDRQVLDYINCLFPEENGLSDLQKKNISRMKEDLKIRYFDAPDLQDVGKNGYRWINAVSDFATHAKPLRETRNYRENLFNRTMEGNTLIDSAYEMICAA